MGEFMKHFTVAFLLLFSGLTVAQTQPFPNLGPVPTMQGILLAAGDMSTSEVDSTPLDLLGWKDADLQAVFTGAPVGNLKLQTSDDQVPNGALVANWSDYTNSSTSVSAAGNFSWHLTSAGYRWVRAVYLKTSGTGALNVTFTRKGTGN